ncbi:hypothetical protein HNY73_000476 [Argiope bruennichi]|uniref:BZIP domain-containing protein n=1 Tax=Argiope bruennichi TaxID=94029 RepID=A0A8T0G2H8_ARGBR|nr:hypothetical protein HNY73_000476 [Argiope bruennichi]
MSSQGQEEAFDYTKSMDKGNTVTHLDEVQFPEFRNHADSNKSKTYNEKNLEIRNPVLPWMRKWWDCSIEQKSENTQQRTVNPSASEAEFSRYSLQRSQRFKKNGDYSEFEPPRKYRKLALVNKTHKFGEKVAGFSAIPQLSFSGTGGKENLPILPTFPSQNHSLRLPQYLSPSAAIAGFHDSTGMFTPYIRTGNSSRIINDSFMVNHANHSYGVSDYSGSYSQSSEIMQQHPFMHSYQEVNHVNQAQQRHMMKRPFQNIDSSAFLPFNRSYVDNNHQMASTTMTSPLEGLSSDSSRKDSGPSENSNEPLSQNSNVKITGKLDNREIRRVPPEERDEKYYERRRRNNIAAQKSRKKRKEREQSLERIQSEQPKLNNELETQNKMTSERLEKVELKLSMVKAKCITFHEKCEGPLKEEFEKDFGSFFNITNDLNQSS